MPPTTAHLIPRVPAAELGELAMWLDVPAHYERVVTAPPEPRTPLARMFARLGAPTLAAVAAREEHR